MSSVDPTHPSSYDLQQAAKDDISNHNLQSVSGDRGLGMKQLQLISQLSVASCQLTTRGHGVRGRMAARRGFTLIELLVVILIILLVSAVALPVVLPALAHRQVSEAARLFKARWSGRGIRRCTTAHPSGIRLLPDPAFPLVYLANGQIDPTQPLAANRIIPIEAAPEYTEGHAGGRRSDNRFQRSRSTFPTRRSMAGEYYPIGATTASGGGPMS